MPLRTNDILQARAAYEALEARAQSAERRATQLQTLIAQLRKLPPPEVDLLSLLRQRILDLETENIGLRNQLDQLAQLNTQDFVVATDLGASIGKASMPDRSITSLEANLAPAERSLYAVLQDKQRLLAEPFLTALAPAR